MVNSLNEFRYNKSRQISRDNFGSCSSTNFCFEDWFILPASLFLKCPPEH